MSVGLQTMLPEQAHVDGQTTGRAAEHRNVTYPQEDSWYSFLLEAESTPGS
jgi:hypothetical protein